MIYTSNSSVSSWGTYSTAGANATVVMPLSNVTVSWGMSNPNVVQYWNYEYNIPNPTPPNPSSGSLITLSSALIGLVALVMA